MSRTETEVEFLKQKLVDIDRQAKLLDETQKDTISSLKALEKTYAEQGKQSESLEQTKVELMKDINDVEAAAFKEFLQSVGLITLQEYEQQSSSEAAKSVNESKNALILKLEKAKNELEVLAGSDYSKTISTLEAALKQEEEKLAALLTGAGQEVHVQKLQQELQQAETDV